MVIKMKGFFSFLFLLFSAAQLRLFRRAAPYPTREEKAVELTDALGRYVTALAQGGAQVPADNPQGRGGDVSATTVTKVILSLCCAIGSSR